nr:MAG: RNA-dependent RNA-polymerase [Picobirnavirus sp.]
MHDIVLPTFESASPHFRLERDKHWNDAVKQNIAELRVMPHIRPASYKRVVDDMRARDTLESNSGWPDFTRRNKPEVIANAVAAAQNGQWAEFPAIALFRNYRQKTRLVWMFPMSANLYEGSYFQPLQSGIVNSGLEFYAPWVGFERVRALITRTYASGDYIFASDFSSTDSHFRWPATRSVNTVLSTLVATDRDGLERSLWHMHNIPLIIGTDKMLTGEHGVSSGSNWTNFVETVFDRTFSYFVQAHTGVKGLYAIGDDMAWTSRSMKEGFAEDLEHLASEAGQITKSEKTMCDPDKVKTLQRLFQRGYSRPDGQLRGVYPTIRALNSLIYPERFHKPSDWSSDMFCARCYMILENCVDHPLFEEFVKFVVKGQKDLIPFAQRGAAALDRIQRKSKLLPGLNPTYTAEKRDSSLASFASIRVARMI